MFHILFSVVTIRLTVRLNVIDLIELWNLRLVKSIDCLLVIILIIYFLFNINRSKFGRFY